jgi:hypothetical protein
MEDSQEFVVDMSKFEESFYRRQDAVKLQKNGRFYTYRSTRIKLSRTTKAPRHTTRDIVHRKTKKQDHRIKIPAYLRPLKKKKMKKIMKEGSKTQRFKTRSKDRVKKRQWQWQELEMNIEE